MIGGIMNRYRSPLEKKAANTLTNWGIKGFQLNYDVDFFEIDIAFPEIKLAVEIDGWDYHNTSSQRLKDKNRQAYLEAKGWKFERFDGWFIKRHTDVMAAKILLRYFEDQTDEVTKKRAMYQLSRYFRDLDPNLSHRLQERALGV